MKTKVIVLLLLITTTCILTIGCSDRINQVESKLENPFDEYNGKESDQTRYEHITVESSVVDAPESMMFEYNGQPIIFQYQMESDGLCEMGLMLFINVIQQPFSVYGEEKNVHKVNLTPNKKEIFPVEFTPVVGENGEEVKLIFANIFNPEVITFKGNINTFGNNQNIFQALPWSIKMNKSIPSNGIKIGNEYSVESFSEEERESFVRVDESGNRIDKLKLCMSFKRKVDNLEDLSILNLHNDKTVQFELYGNFPGRYRVSLFGDLEHIPINGYDYIDVKVSGEKKYVINIPVNENQLDKYENIFATAVSLDNIQGLLRSNSIYVDK